MAPKTPPAAYTSSSVPVARSLRFNLPADRAWDWHPLGANVVSFNNALSVFFPIGEQFFIDSVRAHKESVEEGSLLAKQVRAFCNQEAFHSREHELYNDAIGLRVSVPVVEFLVGSIFFFFKRLSWALCLAGTVGLEHLTATLGATLLMDDAKDFEGVEPHFLAIWRWHALEECEHKAVAFDVFTQAYGSGLGAYVLRIVGFLLSQMIFMLVFAPLFIFCMIRSGGFFSCRAWGALLQHHWGKNGLIRRVVPLYFSFFEYRFHPWGHDNSAEIAHEHKRLSRGDQKQS